MCPIVHSINGKIFLNRKPKNRHSNIKGVHLMRNPNNIQQIMDDRNITYRQLSKMTGVSWSALHKIANYDRSPTQDTMIAIAKGLNMKVDEVFNLEY